MPTHLRFNEDHSDYDATDSDEDYTENEKILLKKVRSKQSKDSESEEEVFGVGGSDEDDDEEEEQSDIALSDVERQDDKDEMPDVRAWGKDKRKFYSTDYVDPDYGGFQGKDAHLAELEEEEARNLQQQLAQQLDDDDFTLDVVSDKGIEEGKKITQEVIKSDISKLSKRQKLEILQKESPEFFGLVEDFKAKMEIVKDHLSPVLKRYRKGQIPNGSAIEFVRCQYELTLNYCVNVYMYLLLKASRVNIQNHPVAKRLYQYRQLLSQLSPVYDEIMKPQIALLLEEKVDEQNQVIPKQKKKLNILSKLNSKAEKREKKQKTDSAEDETSKKKVKFNDEILQKNSSDEDAEMSEENVNAPDQENSEKEATKRAITYQIAKNKGLTPHRKKEQRNPRVKHRNKFRKAKIRRKGAVREPRTELKRYGGEISGIKAYVSKSIKIK